MKEILTGLVYRVNIFFFVHQLVDMATDFMFGHGIWLWVGRDTEDGEETGTIFVFGIVGCKRKMVT
jgi:hypothetical protein